MLEASPSGSGGSFRSITTALSGPSPGSAPPGSKQLNPEAGPFHIGKKPASSRSASPASTPTNRLPGVMGSTPSSQTGSQSPAGQAPRPSPESDPGSNAEDSDSARSTSFATPKSRRITDTERSPSTVAAATNAGGISYQEGDGQPQGQPAARPLTEDESMDLLRAEVLAAILPVGERPASAYKPAAPFRPADDDEELDFILDVLEDAHNASMTQAEAIERTSQAGSERTATDEPGKDQHQTEAEQAGRCGSLRSATEGSFQHICNTAAASMEQADEQIGTELPIKADMSHPASQEETKGSGQPSIEANASSSTELIAQAGADQPDASCISLRKAHEAITGTEHISHYRMPSNADEPSSPSKTNLDNQSAAEAAVPEAEVQHETCAGEEPCNAKQGASNRPLKGLQGQPAPASSFSGEPVRQGSEMNLPSQQDPKAGPLETVFDENGKTAVAEAAVKAASILTQVPVLKNLPDSAAEPHPETLPCQGDHDQASNSKLEKGTQAEDPPVQETGADSPAEAAGAEAAAVGHLALHAPAAQPAQVVAAQADTRTVSQAAASARNEGSAALQEKEQNTHASAAVNEQHLTLQGLPVITDEAVATLGPQNAVQGSVAGSLDVEAQSKDAALQTREVDHCHAAEAAPVSHQPVFLTPAATHDQGLPTAGGGDVAQRSKFSKLEAKAIAQDSDMQGLLQLGNEHGCRTASSAELSSVNRPSCLSDGHSSTAGALVDRSLSLQEASSGGSGSREGEEDAAHETTPTAADSAASAADAAGRAEALEVAADAGRQTTAIHPLERQSGPVASGSQSKSDAPTPAAAPGDAGPSKWDQTAEARQPVLKQADGDSKPQESRARARNRQQTALDGPAFNLLANATQFKAAGERFGQQGWSGIRRTSILTEGRVRVLLTAVPSTDRLHKNIVSISLEPCDAGEMSPQSCMSSGPRLSQSCTMQEGLMQTD